MMLRRQAVGRLKRRVSSLTSAALVTPAGASPVTFWAMFLTASMIAIIWVFGGEEHRVLSVLYVFAALVSLADTGLGRRVPRRWNGWLMTSDPAQVSITRHTTAVAAIVPEFQQSISLRSLECSTTALLPLPAELSSLHRHVDMGTLKLSIATQMSCAHWKLNSVGSMVVRM